ncbi:MAG: hypothetical protein M1405_02685 [Patescibacteria group bacterium]|nr:hypothetical protein [Patescibacteria group bacterium]
MFKGGELDMGKEGGRSFGAPGRDQIPKGLSVHGGTETVGTLKVLSNGVVRFGESQSTDYLGVRRGEPVPGTRRRPRNPGQRY